MIKKNYPLLISTTFLLMFLTSCDFLKNCTKGSGEIIEKQLVISAFEQIELLGEYSVFLSQGKEQKITVKAQSNLVNLINTSVSRKRWEIKFNPCVETKEAIEIYIQVPDLTSISVKGSGKIIGDSIFNTNKLKLNIEGSGSIKMEVETKELSSKIDGSGDLNLSGKTKKHQIEVNGSGDVNAFELSSAEAEIEIKGSGDVKVDVSYALDASVNGSGDIYYKGSVKKINSSVDGSGRLNQAN